MLEMFVTVIEELLVNVLSFIMYKLINIKGTVHPKNENSVIIFSLSCRLKDGFSFWFHKTLLEAHRKTVSQNLPDNVTEQ